MDRSRMATATAHHCCNPPRVRVLSPAQEDPTMRKLLLAMALLMGLSFVHPAAAHAGFFFSLPQPGFGIAVGGPPCSRPACYYPPAPVVYAPPPVVYGAYPVYAPYYAHPYGWGGGRYVHGYRWR